MTSYYLSAACYADMREEQLKQAVDDINGALSDEVMRPFDTVAVRGFSGAMFGTLLAQAFKADVWLVRKEDDCSTHGQPVEGPCASRFPRKGVLVVDDLVASGNTMRRLVDGLGQELKRQDLPWPELSGVYLYENGGLYLPWAPRQNYCVYKWQQLFVKDEWEYAEDNLLRKWGA